MRRKYEQSGEPEIVGRHLVLVDFGAAKTATTTALMKTGTTIGSPEYIAPEQAREKRYLPATSTAWGSPAFIY